MHVSFLITMESISMRLSDAIDPLKKGTCTVLPCWFSTLLHLHQCCSIREYLNPERQGQKNTGRAVADVVSITVTLNPDVRVTKPLLSTAEFAQIRAANQSASSKN